ncbi:F-box/LRR-repeat protein At3g26922-like [Cryptomeria japonica]|uniref:F-box/LRR-repeat protein At3g26922-like n=1 Tax=Cryptomeria japonica TaxID=3369 RepID=UPI0027DA8736|nr:F-box/LRR-repeat protein At3g26922-like [Cryptomeria japonica]
MARKRIRLGLNDLPDSLLIFILSKISFKQAVRCSVLSKRWKFFWTVLPNLKFSTGDFSASSCSRAVDNIFKLHSGLLERFEFNKSSCTRRSRDKICEWISYAALKDVRELSIEESTSRPYEVPISIFLCQSLRFLALSNFLLTNMPDSFAGFAGLATLNLYNVEVRGKTIELMLQLCPVLEILILCKCKGLHRLQIYSDSLIFLNLSSEIAGIKANCPRLETLILSKKMWGSTVEAEFYLPSCLSLCTYVAQLKRITTLKSVRNITLLDLIRKYEVKILREFPDLEQLCFDTAGCSSSDFSYWEYLNSFSKFSATFSLENLKRVHLNMTIFYDPTPLLTCLLPRAPAMKTLLVSRKKGFKSIKARQFLNRLGNFQREYTEIEILLSRNTLKEGRCLSCEF